MLFPFVLGLALAHGFCGADDGGAGGDGGEDTEYHVFISVSNRLLKIYMICYSMQQTYEYDAAYNDDVQRGYTATQFGLGCCLDHQWSRAVG